MAKKKPVRKASPKTSTTKASKQKSMVKKSKPASSSKRVGAAKKGKVVKASSKGQKKGQAALKKKTVSSKKTTITKPSAPRSVAAMKASSVVQKKKESGKTKKALTRPPSPSGSFSTRSAKPKTRMEPLSPTERYNLGGLFACAIDRVSDPDFKRLRAVLRHLDLPSQEKDNLLRLSQGVTIPRLFADGVGEHKISQTLTDMITFALGEGSYEKKWRDEIRQVGTWLGFFPQQFEQIEQNVLAKR